MEVIGGTRSQDLNVTGIATLTSARGFIEKHTGYVEDVIIELLVIVEHYLVRLL